MSKVFDATCDANGKVMVEGVVIPSAEVLTNGKASSVGLLFLDKEQARYLTSSASDIVLTIDQLIATLDALVEALNKIATTFTSVGAGMTGPSTAPPPTLPVDVAAITAKATALGVIKSDLETLKGGLK